ncbi:carboxylesterase/lipase family protein [Nocardia sp. BMG51109]|uniref:carboxylesterase/lipase family protein n=1 Tax=Nocardia sp. BMG51109 TaxID=1056816 RepID=UPI000685A03B|nr:carboxylesterase family protein [Nocardia sp. BMG51109]
MWAVAAVAMSMLVACGPDGDGGRAGTGDPLLVRTSSGEVRGHADGEARRFAGIPYAAAPTGERRWAAPQPAAPWPGVRDAVRPGPPCPQGDGTGKPLAGTSEDCLNLEVTAPRSEGAKPVMVWLHGGGNDTGHGSEYDPARMAAIGDVIVVTVDYRLGALGFLGYPGLPGSGSFGLLDQQAALRWVRDNAAAFGGDPDNVTVFGQSAGAVDACAQLTSPGARGLFHKVILQSGSCHTLIPSAGAGGRILTSADTFWAPLDARERQGESLAAELHCADLACLRRIPPEDLVRATSRAGIAVGTPTLPVAPDRADAAPVPVLSGTTRDESRLTTMYAEFTTGPLTRERYEQVLTQAFGTAADEVRSRYPLRDYDDQPRLAFSAIDTDRVFACPQLATGRRLAAGSAVYAYEFADRTAPTMSPFLTDMPAGAAHGSELAYLFGARSGGPWGPGFAPQPLSAEQRDLSDAMIRAWTGFARTGRPAETWPAFTPDRPRAHTFALGAADSTDVATAHHCDLWDGLARR